ncbi:MAG: 30S ribosomal protein S13 [Chloroflexi bacterium]|nr:30S ribosomal protein S13 [Chloroflexota bacterium]
MARIAGVDVPNEKKARIALRYIYGIGPTLADEVVRKAGINGEARVKDLAEGELDRLRETLDKGGYLIEGDLRRTIAMNLRRLVEIGSYRGTRHRRGLPVRGQRTRTNARSRRGARKTVAGRRRTAAKK